ncbi:MAG: alanine racemase [Bacillota bacterium]
MYKWIEINLDAILNNYLKIREFINKETKVLGVVKADAYGHGIIEVGQELEKAGIDYLGVTELDEGIQLRKAGVEVPILVFEPLLPEESYLYEKFKLTASLSDFNTIQLISSRGDSLKVHLKLETGLGRTGLKFPELPGITELLKGNSNLEVEGVYSHLSTAMRQDSSYTEQQFAFFQKGVKFLAEKGLKIPLKHICNSAALAKFPHMHLDMVRAGTILYGQETGGKHYLGYNLENGWALKGQITYINNLPQGHPIGYEKGYTLRRNSKTAIVPIGFHHGFSVEPVPRPKGMFDLIKVLGKIVLRFIDHPRMKTYVKVGDKLSPVLGKVGMQMTIIDITGMDKVKVGDIVELPGRRTNISPLLPKVFLKEGKPVKIRKIDEKYEEIRMTAK